MSQKSHFLFDFQVEQLNDQEMDLEENCTPNSLRRTTKFLDPYHLKKAEGFNRHDVHICHFREARLYDHQITEPGWEIQRIAARNKYKNWLRAVRRIPGWEGFRRMPREVLEEVEDENGNIIVVKKLVPYRVPGLVIPRRDAGKNRKSKPISQSRVKGAGPDDENFQPKMFTEAMGRQISQLRNKLGMTQAELGKKINVDANMIRNIELGGLISFNPEDVLVKSLAKALGVPSIKYQE